MEVIGATGLCKAYGQKLAVDCLDMTIPEGAVYGFIGQNGAGKSTTQKMVCGLAKPTSGGIRLFEKPVSDAEARKKIGMLIESAGLYPGLTARENLTLYGKCIGLEGLDKRVAESLELTGLSETGKKPVKNFSMGMKQRAGIGLAILGDPKLLVLDEPINGLDPEGIREFRKIIGRLNQEKGMTIFISSHILGELSKIATHYGIIRQGKMVMETTAAKLSKECEDYICVRVKNTAKAAELLKQSMHLKKCELCPDGEIHIYEFSDPEAVARKLFENGFPVSEIFLHKQDLEEYFLRLMAAGGQNNA